MIPLNLSGSNSTSSGLSGTIGDDTNFFFGNGNSNAPTLTNEPTNTATSSAATGQGAQAGQGAAAGSGSSMLGGAGLGGMSSIWIGFAILAAIILFKK